LPSHEASDKRFPEDCLYLAKLKANIEHPDDLQLASLELQPLTKLDFRPVSDLISALPLMTSDPDVQALIKRRTYPGRPQAYMARGPVVDLRPFLFRSAFFQDIYVKPLGTRLEALASQHLSPPPIRCGDGLLRFVPVSVYLELSSAIGTRAGTSKEAIALFEELRQWILAGYEDGSKFDRRGKLNEYVTHGLHKYKAKFFPRMVRAAMNFALANSGPRAVVLDPFVGSGTALLEAALAGFPSVGVDIDPLSVRIATSKIDLLTVEPLLLESELLRIERYLRSASKGQAMLDAVPGSAEPYRLPLFLRRKMDPAVVAEIEREVTLIRTALGSCSDETLRNAFYVLLSHALAKKLRMRFHGLGHGRFALEILRVSIVNEFLNNARQIAINLATFQAIVENCGLRPCLETKVLLGDAKAVPLASDSVDCIITSPPYIPSSSGRETYLKGKAASLFALELVKDEHELAELETIAMGTMTRSFAQVSRGELPPSAWVTIDWLKGDQVRHDKAVPTLLYYLDLKRALGEMFRVLRPGGVAVLVVAREHTFYTYKERETLFVAPNAEAVGELATDRKYGGKFELLHRIDVQLAKDNPHARPKASGAYYETMLFLRKPRQAPMAPG